MRISDWSSDVCSSDLRRHGRHLPAGRRRRSVRPSFTDLKKRDGSMTDIATLSDLERLVEERAIERVLSDYAYYLDMNMPDRMRSEERRVGKEGGSTGRSRWSQ